MAYTSVSSKYQIVIPKEVREKMPLKPGQKLIVHELGGVIYLVPILPAKKLRGLFKDRGFEAVVAEDIRDKSDRPE